MSDFHSHDSLTAHSLERIADTLDDYMDMTLAVQQLTVLQRDPEVAEALAPLMAVIDRIRHERELREYEVSR